MDIDLSKIVLIVLAVLPGYLALRGSDRVIPRTQRKKGATEEIAGFLIFSVTVHLTLAVLYTCSWALAGILYNRSAYFFIGDWLPLTLSQIFRKLGGIPAVYLAIYLILSLGVGWSLGLGQGFLDVWLVAERITRKLGIEKSLPGRFWSKNIGRFLITGRPIIYDALFPDLNEKGEPKEVFAELILKEQRGSITGRVTSFSIANDEESHKLIYLQDIYRKDHGSDQYEKLDADGILVDISDAIMLQIKQV